MYFVYVLKSKVDGFHYIGHSINTEDRVKKHNRGKVKTTKSHRPLKIIYVEEFKTRSEAQKREYYLKRGKGNFWIRSYLKEKGLW